MRTSCPPEQRTAVPSVARSVAALAGPRPVVRRLRTRSVRPSLLLELVVVLCLVRVYDLARRLADVHRERAVDTGEAVLRAEQLAHVALERTANAWTAGHLLVATLASWYYEFAHLFAALAVLLWCWWARPRLYRSMRNALVLINLIGLAVFLALPVAPPRLLPGAGFQDVVADAGFGASHAGRLPADQYGAMPSLHVAWATWVCLVVHRAGAPLWVRRLALVHPLVTAVVVVLTGNHYVLDVLGGAGTAMLAVAVARPLPSIRLLSWPARQRVSLVEVGDEREVAAAS